VQSELNRLRWQCRRGLKELDAILCYYLDNNYVQAESVEQHLFLELLTLEDDQLIAYFFSETIPKNKGLAQFVHKIRATFMD